jgi:hypothetical protein
MGRTPDSRARVRTAITTERWAATHTSPLQCSSSRTCRKYADHRRSALRGCADAFGEIAEDLLRCPAGGGCRLYGLSSPIAASQTASALLVSVPIVVRVDRYGPARPFVIGSFAAGSIYACG